MQRTITFKVNGQLQTVTTESSRPLLDVLREDLNLTGTKYGCGEGQCGACVVLIGGRVANACVFPIGRAEQQEILTIEGLAQGDQLHPVQQAFLDEEAIQCGFCTPGMILSAVVLLGENPQPTEAEIRKHLQGQVCRCCGYPRIIAAVQRAAQAVHRKES